MNCPDGLFYAASFAQRAEAPLAQAFGAGSGGLEALRVAAAAAGGLPLELADAAYAFQALPRLALAALVWAGDDEFPAQASMVFDAAAGHYLPAEDLAGLGGLLARRLIGGGTLTTARRRPQPNRWRVLRGRARWPRAAPPARRCRS